MPMINELDTHSEYVRGRIIAINPARTVNGVIEASDWPPEKVLMESFYCLSKGMRPMGKSAYTPSAPAMTYMVQWVWLISGTDIPTGQDQANRGDRYRTHLTMCEELRQGLWPNFTEKLQYSVDANGNLVSSSLATQDFFWWSPGTFRHKVDSKSGLLYGYVDVNLGTFTSLITS